MRSEAATVDEYLAELDPERREQMQTVRELVNANLDPALQECMQYGMISWVVPHSVFPQGYHTDPSKAVPVVSLASQKRHMSLYLMCVYADSEEERALRDAYAQAGKKIDMGKSCLRLRTLADLEAQPVAELLQRVSVEEYLDQYVASVGPQAWKRRR